MTDILEEVLNDNNEERKLYYFKKLLPIIVILTLIIVLLMIINNWYEAKKTNDNQQVGDILVKAITTTDNQDLSIKSLEHLIETSDNKVKELAQIEQINLQIKQNNFSKADTLLQKVINNKDYDEITTSYAKLMWLSLRVDKSNLSTINNNETTKKIEEYFDYFDTSNKPFYGTANLIKAYWYIKNGSENLAVALLGKLISEEVSESVKEQAKILLTSLVITK